MRRAPAPAPTSRRAAGGRASVAILVPVAEAETTVNTAVCTYLGGPTIYLYPASIYGVQHEPRDTPPLVNDLQRDSSNNAVRKTKTPLQTAIPSLTRTQTSPCSGGARPFHP